ncbi:flagellar hook-length control protein FliK [Burkholderia territorii]|uniref:Flagellar hook-length control protein FliK n=1 Tax=Burkholderia territorii TaxID=1503055 RepID=A0A6L3NFI4_9BURK|nr:flagellar hook-length control protein FliK [Burkholderia territorii]KAB0673868.1 flagellar hook-length control protein FliK [Burkholderia territorii]MBM2773383.1 flagellar hook-length control protein FliK [Burkholderia territorii]VWB29129.1 flagellar hook-length control protein FliK [Burkholderia territorii]
MTESVSLSRSRSRADRSSARSRPRPRAVAAAADNAARATARPGNATGGDAPRDERTLDLFGDPVLEPAVRGPVVSRDDEAMDAGTAATVADSEDDAGRQAMLDGFGTPGAVGDAVEPALDFAKTAVSASTPGNGDLADSDADVVRASAVDATTRGEALPSDGVAMTTAGALAADGGRASAGSVAKTGDAAGAHADRSTANAGAAEGALDAVIGGGLAKPAGQPEGAAAPVTYDEAVRTSGETTTKGRRTSSGSGGKRRVAAGARSAPAARSAPEAAAVDAVPESLPAQPPAPSIEQSAPAVAAIARDDARPAAAPASPLVQPVASAASFVTKPSADRAQPAASSASAFDPDTQLRPLSDRLAALQAETAGMKQAADREMRRVNRLLLALAIVVFAGLVALVLQTRQIAHLKQEVDARQQRIDRLAADLSTQQATLMTLAEHHEAMLSQVDRLQRNANREAAAAKRTRRTR